MKQYSVALSFASEQRTYVDAVAEALKRARVHYFYDRENQAELWGTPLPRSLQRIYMSDAECVVMFISKDYAKKIWTKHEFRSAMSTAIRSEREYILPVRFDDTILEGLDVDAAYLDVAKFSPEEVATLLVKKLRQWGVITSPQQLVDRRKLGSLRAQSLVEGMFEPPPMVDDAICLTEVATGAGVDVQLTQRNDGFSTESRKWSRADLERTLNDRSWTPEALALLRQQLPLESDYESSDMKVGLSRVVRAVPRRRQPTILSVELWPWWVEREFNRRLLRGSENSYEERLARHCAHELFTVYNDAGSYELKFPCGFYVEVAVVDQVGHVLLLAKDSKSVKDRPHGPRLVRPSGSGDRHERGQHDQRRRAQPSGSANRIHPVAMSLHA